MSQPNLFNNNEYEEEEIRKMLVTNMVTNWEATENEKTYMSRVGASYGHSRYNLFTFQDWRCLSVLFSCHLVLRSNGIYFHL